VSKRGQIDGIFAGVQGVCAVSSHDPTGKTILTFHLVFDVDSPLRFL
jgi:hypothetical protein